MSNLSQYLSSLPAGAIIQSPANIADPNWLRCDGSIVARASYPSLSALMGTVGAFTNTIRTPASASAAGAVASNGTNLVAAAANGTAALQYSTNNGVSWSTATTPASYSPGAIVWDGTNFISANIGSSQQSLYSPTGVTWTAATGYIGGGGAVQIATNGAGTTITTGGATVINLSTNHGVSWTQPTLASAGVAAGDPLVWTGTQFMHFNANGVEVSATGASGTWSKISLPYPVAASSQVVSDGASNVLATAQNTSIAWVSRDGGNTWKSLLLPTVSLNTTPQLSYANGRWIAKPANLDFGACVSSDLNSWVYVPLFGQIDSAAAAYGVAYVGGNYCIVSSYGSITTVTEDTTKLYLPSSRRSVLSAGNGQVFSTSYQEWIKVQ